MLAWKSFCFAQLKTIFKHKKTHSTKLVRVAGLSASTAVVSSSSPGASSPPVSPTSMTSPLSPRPPCISTSPESSATPPKMRTSGSAILAGTSVRKPKTFYAIAREVVLFVFQLARPNFFDGSIGVQRVFLEYTVTQNEHRIARRWKWSRERDSGGKICEREGIAVLNWRWLKSFRTWLANRAKLLEP